MIGATSRLTFGASCKLIYDRSVSLAGAQSVPWLSALSVRSLFGALLFLSAVVIAQGDLPQREGFSSHMTELSDDELDGLGGEWRVDPEPDNTWRKKDKKEKSDSRMELGVDYEQMQQQMRYQKQLQQDQLQRDREPHPGTQFRVRF